jgi:hypothetical protein
VKRATDVTEIVKRSNYVDPGPKPAPVVYVEPAPLTPLPTNATTAVELRTTYEDRARGFQLATLPVAIAFGVGALVVAVAGWSVPVLSVTALVVFWVAFLVWWVAGWAIHHIASPDGVALLSAILGYRYLRHEQKERLRRMKGQQK